MKDQYAGDIGDFGKYGLLRALCKGGGLRLGMAWWMTPDVPGSKDGKFIAYLRNRDRRLRECDPQLFDSLALLLDQRRRSVGAVCESGILPDGTLHHNSVLHFPTGSLPEEKKSIRSGWLSEAKAALKEADLVFADPDNCLSDSAGATSKNAPKYVTSEDMKRLIDVNTGVVVYHHLNRSAKAPVQLDQAAQLLQSAIGRRSRPWTVWYHRGTARGFLISPADHHRDLLRSRLDAFLAGPWGENGHFEETG